MRRQAKIEDQALDWLMRRDGGEWAEEDQAELDTWLAESMAHKAAFWRAEHGWQAADRIRALGSEDGFRTTHGAKTSSWRLPAAVAASVLAIITVVGISSIPQPSVQPVSEARQLRLDTPVGGRRTEKLSDGSTIELNTQTVVRAAVGNESRQVWLDVGEAFFDVVKREGQPFVIYAGRKTITVLGTKFSVRHDENGRVTVNVVEGRVRLEDSKAVQGSQTIITAGDISTSLGPSTLLIRNADKRVKAALAWRDDMLQFDQTPLAEVVAEFNRYNSVPLVLTDSQAAQILIGGSFSVSSEDAFVRLLHDAYGLKIERDDKSVKISSP